MAWLLGLSREWSIHGIDAGQAISLHQERQISVMACKRDKQDWALAERFFLMKQSGDLHIKQSGLMFPFFGIVNAIFA